MRKKIIIALTVIVAGLMLGVIFSKSFLGEKQISNPATTNIPTQPQSNNNNIPKTNSTVSGKKSDIQLNIVANPVQIAISKNATDEAINKSTIAIVYKNNTNNDLIGVKAKVVSKTKVPFQTSSSKTATINKTTKTTSGNYFFDVADVKAGKEQKADIFVSSKQAGQITLSVVVRTKEGKEFSSKPVTITVR